MDKELDLIPIENWGFEKSKPFLIAGPCSAESQEQMINTAKKLKEIGVSAFRAGTWKPRTRPNAFEGEGEIALKWFKSVKDETGLPVTTEVANAAHTLAALKHGIDILWIGARTTVNPFGVQEIADVLKGVDVPVLIKNPVNPDLELWIGAIERIYQAGIKRLGVIHRGFSTAEKSKFRNAPHWHIVLELKRRFPNLSIVCDPSHICGNREGIHDISQNALDLCYDGLMIETHLDPDNAKSDAKQQITPDRFKQIKDQLKIRKESTDDKDYNATLTTLRKHIDEIDNDILNLLQIRMSISKTIGIHKKSKNIGIFQENRYDEILQKFLAKGKSFGLTEEFSKKLLEIIHEESVIHQEEVMKSRLYK